MEGIRDPACQAPGDKKIPVLMGLNKMLFDPKTCNTSPCKAINTWILSRYFSFQARFLISYCKPIKLDGPGLETLHVLPDTVITRAKIRTVTVTKFEVNLGGNIGRLCIRAKKFHIYLKKENEMLRLILP